MKITDNYSSNQNKKRGNLQKQRENGQKWTERI